jgi:hypothetical protein
VKRRYAGAGEGGLLPLIGQRRPVLAIGRNVRVLPLLLLLLLPMLFCIR